MIPTNPRDSITVRKKKRLLKFRIWMFSTRFSRYRRWGTRVSRPGPVAWVRDDRPRCPRHRRRAPRRPRPPRPPPCPVPRPPVPAGARGNTSSSRTSTYPTSSPRTCCTPTGNKDLRHPSISAPRRVGVRDYCSSVPLDCRASVVWR